MASSPPTSLSHTNRPMKVFMMDLWATVPYYTAYLSQALLAQGIDIQIGSITYYLDRACFSSRNLKLDPGLSDIVGHFAHLPRALRRLLKLIEGLLNILALTVRFLFRPPDIVHVQFLPMLRSPLPIDLWFVRFCRWRGARIVLTVHDLLPHDTAEQYKHLYRRLYASMDALICHSAHIKTRLEQEFGLAPEAITIIPHGPFFYDLPQTDSTVGSTAALRQLGLEPDQQMVLWQGIIFPYKGVDLLLEAWKHVEEQSPNLVLVVLGNGDPILTASLEDHARRLALQRVRFHFRFCSVEDLVAAYRAALTVIYPYRAITTSGALATGLALGKPIIAANLPVFRELLTHESNALLVDPTDPEALAAAITRLASDPTLRDSLSTSVRSMRFGSESWRHIAIETAALYRRLVSNPN
jgi:glycosyltransferase involved in cell wall biosynthesis